MTRREAIGAIAGAVVGAKAVQAPGWVPPPVTRDPLIVQAVYFPTALSDDLVQALALSDPANQELLREMLGGVVLK
jgi:hypothetical protein